MDEEVAWLDAQRIPGNEIAWHLGLYEDKSVPVSYEVDLSLSVGFESSGAGLWLERSTGLSVLRTLPENEEAQGSMNPRVEKRKHADLDLLKEIPDPHPHSLIEHAWARFT